MLPPSSGQKFVAVHEIAQCDSPEEHNPKLRNMYSSPNIIVVVKPRTIRVSNVARVGGMRNGYYFLVGKQLERSNMGVK
jgi:hypothetical protein